MSGSASMMSCMRFLAVVLVSPSAVLAAASLASCCFFLFLSAACFLLFARFRSFILSFCCLLLASFLLFCRRPLLPMFSPLLLSVENICYFLRKPPLDFLMRFFLVFENFGREI